MEMQVDLENKRIGPLAFLRFVKTMLKTVVLKTYHPDESAEQTGFSLRDEPV
jgi:hypothetical protein